MKYSDSFVYPWKASLLVALCFTLLHTACSDEFMVEDYSSSQKNNRPRVISTFQQNHPISDSFFNDKAALSQGAVQLFLERSPYGRSWLADYTISGQKASTMIYNVAQSKGLNPILLLSRLQVEASLISANSRPSQYLIDRAMGCGCHDGQACQASYLGLENQILCAAQKFRGLYNKSADGSGWWRKGLGKSSLDHIWIVPESHATAALYAYTPWVLKGSGGTWLAWKTAQLFDEHARTEGLDRLDRSQGSSNGWGSSGDHCGSFSDVNSSHPGFGWIEAASEQGWVSGCGGDLFCPDESLTRAQAAHILTQALGLSNGSNSRLTDLQGHWAKESIQAVISAEIMSGCTADRFCPDETLTRAQAAVIVAKAGLLSSDRSSSFKDVPYDHWARPFIAALEDKNYIGGCSRDEFCLDAPTRRWLFVTWLGQILSLEKYRCR